MFVEEIGLFNKIVQDEEFLSEYLKIESYCLMYNDYCLDNFLIGLFG